MTKGNVLFGIDAADCHFHAPFFENYWQWVLEHYQTHNPTSLPIVHEMMQRIAQHPELPDLAEQELVNAPGPALEHLARLGRSSYGDNLRKMHASLVQTLPTAGSV